MKKLTAILLLVALLVTMTACNGNEKNDPTTEPTVNTTEGKNETTANTEPSVEATEPSAEATEPSVEATEPSVEATEPVEGGQAGLTGTMEEIVGKIIEAAPVQFMGGVLPLDLTDTSEEGLWALKNFTGLDSADSITDVSIFESMTGSQAFSLVMVRVAEGKDAKTVAQTMKDNINPRKWICVGADQIAAAGCGDVVMFIMVDSNLGLTSQSYVDAFTTLCGGKVDFSI